MTARFRVIPARGASRRTYSESLIPAEWLVALLMETIPIRISIKAKLRTNRPRGSYALHLLHLASSSFFHSTSPIVNYINHAACPTTTWKWVVVVEVTLRVFTYGAHVLIWIKGTVLMATLTKIITFLQAQPPVGHSRVKVDSLVTVDLAQRTIQAERTLLRDKLWAVKGL